MSFYNELVKWKEFDFDGYFSKVTDEDVLNSIGKDKLTVYDYLNLLSPIAQNHLEAMAVKATKLTRQHFGNVIGLYLPIYVSNYCTSNCIYCGFSKKNHIKRRHMKFEEIEHEAQEIAKSGIGSILLLTGEAKVEDMPIEMQKEFKLVVGKDKLEKLGITLPEDLMNKATMI